MEILFSNVEDVVPEDAPHPEAATEVPAPEEQPVAEQPLAEQPLAEQPVAEQPLAEQPVVEQAIAEQPSTARPSFLKVSARSRPSAVAGAIAGVVRETGRAEVQAIGAGATNQAIKAVAIARSYLQEDGIDIVCIPSFTEVIIEKEERTAIRLVVEQR